MFAQSESSYVSLFFSFRGGLIGSRMERGVARSDGLGLRGGVEQRVEEELVGDFRDSAVLWAEAEEDQMALPNVLLCDDGGTFEVLSTQDPTALQRSIRGEGCDGLGSGVNIEERAVFVKDRHGRC